MSNARNNNRGRTMMIDNRISKPKYNNTCDKCHDSEPRCESCYKEPKKWNALDPTDEHPFNCSTVVQDRDPTSGNVQQSDQQSIESIVVKDSCDIEVSSTDTHAALNIQVALQVAIAIVVSISIADSNQADTITQDFFAKLKSSQTNKQQVYIENSRGVNITTTDTDITVNIQILLQVLIALVASLDVL